MGNFTSAEGSCESQTKQRLNECEILSRGLGAAECGALWNTCEKNPGHEKFIPVERFTDQDLPYPLTTEKREMLKAFIDLTVRVRVQWTSPARPDEDDLSQYRGTDKLRLGSGFVRRVSEPNCDEPCPCDQCDGKISKKYWKFTVQTARHVVFNTEEAKEAKVDLFYNDDHSHQDGRMKTVRAVKVVWATSNWDICQILCVTHDESLGERLRLLEHCWAPLSVNSIYSPENRVFLLNVINKDSKPEAETHAMIISHPHGQPKKITVGKWISSGKRSDRGSSLEYHTATCPGSSGAPILLMHSLPDPGFLPWSGPVHSGTYNKKFRPALDQVNYSNSLNQL